MPLPHYIKRGLENKERYQTVYSKQPGSAAAPTAGLHFTLEMLDELRSMGINIGYVTLHVGLGTFRPVKAERIEEHKMHSEHYYMPKETADLINHTKQRGGRVICVGTTSCRTVETVASLGEIKECRGDTSIFIYSGYKFKCMDALITNFHLPSTLIMLVAAFAGYENTMNAYKIAVEENTGFTALERHVYLLKDREIMFKILQTEHNARRGSLPGRVQTPAFMNVATSAAIKAGCRPLTLRNLNARLCYAIPTTCI